MIGNQFLLGIAAELVIDLFAGGGGASTGIEQAIGRHVDIAVNHDAKAVSLHEANHPQTRHFVADVFEGDPWPTFAHSPTWSWMHSDACRADPAGSGKAVCHDRRIAGALREAWPAVALVQTPTPPARVRQAQIDLFQGIAA